MKSILDKNFKYVPSHATDIRKTIRRVQEQQKQNEVEKHEKVHELPRRKTG